MYGNSEQANLAYVTYGITILGKSLTNSKKVEDEAYTLGTLGIEISNRYKLNQNKAISYSLYAFFISYRRNPINDSARYFAEGYLIAKETGVAKAASICLIESCSALFLVASTCLLSFKRLKKH